MFWVQCPLRALLGRRHISTGVAHGYLIAFGEFTTVTPAGQVDWGEGTQKKSIEISFVGLLVPLSSHPYSYSKVIRDRLYNDNAETRWQMFGDGEDCVLLKASHSGPCVAFRAPLRNHMCQTY